MKIHSITESNPRIYLVEYTKFFRRLKRYAYISEKKNVSSSSFRWADNDQRVSWDDIADILFFVFENNIKYFYSETGEVIYHE